MDTLDAPATPEPNDNISRMMREHGVPEADIARMHAQSEFARQASFCSLSSGYFFRLAEGKLSGAELAQAQGIHAHFAAMDPDERKQLGELIWKAQSIRKPAKLGKLVSQARALAGPHAPFAIACMLDTMVMSLAASDAPFSDKKALIPLVARHIGAAPDELLVSIATRCCYNPDPDLLGLVLAHGAKADGLDGMGHSPLAMAARQDGSPAVMTKVKAKALECIRVLLAHGARVESANDRGHSCLAVAARSKFWQACDLLLDHGADPFARGPDGAPIDDLLALEHTRSRALGLAESRAIAMALGGQASPAASRKPRI